MKTTIPIKGMHCRSCEILIGEKLQEIKGLKNISVSYKKKTAEFVLNYPATIEQIKTAVAEAGYEVGDDEKELISKNISDYKDLGVAFLVLVALYFLAKYFGLINLNINSSNPSSLAVVLIIGLTAGISTCMALVGGLVLGISARHAEKHPEASPLQRFRPHLFFNLGRIASYFLLGGLIGLVGKAFQLSSPLLGILTIIVGIVMLILGVQLTEIFPKITSTGLTLPPGIAKFLGIKKHHEKEYSHLNSIITGALTFFLPCGFTQAMQLYAMSTGNFFSGAVIMGIFALGTAPGLLGIGGLTSVIKGAFAKKFFKFAGLLVIFLALFNISNGYNLTGFKGISFGNRNISKDDPNVKIIDGNQIVKMEQDTAGYKPNKFTIRRGIQTQWIINATDTNSCSGSIVAPKIKVKQFLQPGINTITFTPTELGEIKFSCSMGMYTGKFIVVENELTNLERAQDQNSLQDNSVSEKSSLNNELPKDAQIVKITYVSPQKDIEPKELTVQAGKPVRVEVDSKVDGQGCMGSIAIPRSGRPPQFLEKGKVVYFDFTPQKGTYYLTCGMGSIRGKINAI